MKFQNSREEQEKAKRAGEGIYVCPKCGLIFENDSWREADPERKRCANGHKITEMQWHPSREEYEKQFPRINDW